MAKLFGKELSRSDILRRAGNITQLASIKPYTMSEGMANGVKAFDVVTGGGLEFTVLESKCLDILNMKYKGVNLSFLAKAGLVAPDLCRLGSVEDFYRSFEGGMLYTCGVTHTGSPASGKGSEYPMHGRIGMTPSEKVSVVSEWRGDEYYLEISGVVRDVQMFGENIVLKRRISTLMGESSFRLKDTIENYGFREEPLRLMYHINFGYPLLDAVSRLVIPSGEVIANNETADAGIQKHCLFEAPSDAYQKQYFTHLPESDSNGDTCALLVNPELEIGVYIKFNTAQFPGLFQWKTMASGDYALGLEPMNRARGRDGGKAPDLKLAPQEAVEYEIELGVVDGHEEISALEECIESLTR